MYKQGGLSEPPYTNSTNSIKMAKGIGNCSIFTTATNHLSYFVSNEHYSPFNT